jgi:hypothetical protein
VNARDIYLCGGVKGYKSLMAREYDETRVCLKVDSKTGEMTKKQDMPEGGSAFGISCIGKYIYVIGGTQ